jgi:hypothetical protein
MRLRESRRGRAGRFRLCTSRRTAGGRPCVTPGTAPHRLTAVTPTGRTVRERPSSRRSSLEPSKITVKGATASDLRVACYASADPGL